MAFNALSDPERAIDHGKAALEILTDIGDPTTARMQEILDQW